MPRLVAVTAIAAAALLAAPALNAQTADWLNGFDFYDLTHPIPLFQPLGGDVTKPDLTKPFKDSVPTAGFGFQPTRKMKSPFKTKIGFFQWAEIYLDEHYGTHIDSTDHYQNDPATVNVSKADNRSTEQYTTKDLVGPIVFIDISERVAKELAKNGGKPSPDAKVTNFENNSGNTLAVADIEKVEGQIVAGAWIVVRSGWDKFFFGTPPQNPFMHPYINGMNYPGFHADVVKKIIEIETKKNIRIAGIAMDNLSIDSGHSGRGPDNDAFGTGWSAHNLGLQRGWKFIENATGLEQLAGKTAGQCAIIVGALKLVSSSGAPARVLAMCRR